MVISKQKNEELFAAWLAQNAPSAHLSELYLCYSEIEAFCLKIKVLHKPLFETMDVDTVKRVQKTIMENRLFRVSHKKQMKKIISATQYYTSFVKSLSSDVVNDVKAVEPIDSIPVEKDNPKSTIDFNHIGNLAYTKPVKISYFGEELNVGTSWTDAYVKLMAALYDDYADDIPIGKSFTGDGRVDFGNRELAKSMKAPKRVFMEMYLETNLSATNIVSKIKALLDICRVDYENIIIEYEPKEDKTPNVKKTRKPHITAEYNFSNSVQGEDAFYSYLHDSLGMAENTCRSYVSAIKSAERFAAEHNLGATRLYNCSAKEVSATAKALFDNVDFLQYNEQQHNRFRAAIKKLLDYMGCAILDSCRNRYSCYTSTMPVNPRPNYNTIPFENVLEKHFVKGFRLGSTLDMKKFKRYYEEANAAPVTEDDDIIEEIIRSCGIVHENKVFLPKTMLNDEVKERLYAYIDRTFVSGKTSIYFEALFRKFSADFLDHYIYDADMLRSYLDFECHDKYIIGRKQLCKEVGKTAEPVDEVRTCLKEHGGLMETDELCATLAHIPKNKIISILGSNLEFVRNSKGEYFHADVLALSGEELDNISKLMEEAIKAHEFMSGTELMNAIRTKYPNTYESYSSYSDIGWRNALKYKLGNRFSFKGNIISCSEETLSMNDVFGKLARDADTLTIDELLAFSKEMGTTIYFDAVYENALRINENTFVSKDQAAFRVEETDAIIDRFCIGNYVPLSAFREFGIFPDAGFPWTIYLMECYAAFYSDRYTLIHGGYNQNCAVGAVAKKSAGYESFDNMIVDVIAGSNIPLKKENALDYLVESGYIARHTYAGIEELLIRANAERNRKGRL